MMSTQAVLRRHVESFAKGDLEGILSDYAPDAVMFTREGPLHGPEGIRPFFQGLIEAFAKPGSTFHVLNQAVAGDYACIYWTAETTDRVYEAGTDTFFVSNGRILAQSFTAQISTKGRRF